MACAYVFLESVVLYESDVEERSPIVSSFEEEAGGHAAPLRLQIADLHALVHRLLRHVSVRCPFTA